MQACLTFRSSFPLTRMMTRERNRRWERVNLCPAQDGGNNIHTWRNVIVRWPHLSSSATRVSPKTSQYSRPRWTFQKITASRGSSCVPISRFADYDSTLTIQRISICSRRSRQLDVTYDAHPFRCVQKSYPWGEVELNWPMDERRFFLFWLVNSMLLYFTIRISERTLFRYSRLSLDTFEFIYLEWKTVIRECIVCKKSFDPKYLSIKHKV